MEAEYLTVAEAAQVAKVTVGTMRAWCRAGRVKAGKAGKGWRVPRSALDVALGGAEPSQA